MKEEKKNPDLSPINQSSMKHIVVFLLLWFSLSLSGQQLDLNFPQANYAGPNGPGAVNAMAVYDDVLYLGGNFTSIEGNNRQHLAAIDLKTGQVLDWKATPNQPVKGITVADGVVYIWGTFTAVNGMARNSLAALDMGTGAVTSFNPTISFPGIPGMQTGTIEDVVVQGDTIFLAGYFLSINGQPRLNLGAVGTDGSLLDWQPQTSTIPFNHILLAGDLIYGSGPFYFPKNGLVAYNRWTAELSDWDPDPNFPGNTFGPLLVDGEDMWVSGPFSGVQFAADRPYLAKVDRLTGQPENWETEFGYGYPGTVAIEALVADEEHLYFGGSIHPLFSDSLQHLGRLDRQTGKFDDWRPTPDLPVQAMLRYDHYLIVGGRFSSIADQSRSLLARFDLELSAVDPGGTVKKWSLFPNPSSGWIRIQCMEEDIVIRVLDITGREVLSRRSGQAASIDLDLSHLAAGPYMVVMASERGSERELIIIR